MRVGCRGLLPSGSRWQLERDSEFDFVVTRRSSDDQPASDALNKDAIAEAEDGGVTLGDAGRIFFSGGRVGRSNFKELGFRKKYG